ncbi:MAG: hypothetical protein ABIJ03_04450 [Patescibacteria group bacterium]|nr:hypothetical protein [Patescibacteria group bacterium]
MFNLISQAQAQVASQGGCNPGEGGLNLGDCLQLSDSTHVSSKYSSLSFLVNLVVRNVFVIAGIGLFIMFFVAGFQFIAKGKQGIEDAKQTATAAVLGFVIMFCAYWIVQLVKYITDTNILL